MRLTSRPPLCEKIKERKKEQQKPHCYLLSEVGVEKETHDKVDVFDVGVPLKLERELVEVPHTHLRLVCPRSDDVVAIASRLYAVARLRELEMLYELDAALHTLANCAALSLSFRRAFPHEPVR